MVISFPGGMQVQAQYKQFSIVTDQPVVNGGSNAAPSPYDLFLASIGTCAGYYALRYCQSRGFVPKDFEFKITPKWNDKNQLVYIGINVQTFSSIPPEHCAGLAKAIESCAVKKVLCNAPSIEVSVT